MEDKTQPHKQTKTISKKTGVVKAKQTKELSDKHILIIEEYYNNGYNKSKAVRTITPDVKSPSAAVHVFNAIASKPLAKKYIEGMQSRLRQSVHISKEQVLQELIHGAYTDATDYIGLTAEELKELPPSTRRQIQSFKATERTEVDRSGNEITTKTIDIKLINKLDSLKEVAKIIGAYELDNKQKSNSIDLSTMTIEDKLLLLRLKEASLKPKQIKTIDITP